MSEDSFHIDDNWRTLKRVLRNVLFVLLGGICVVLARMPQVYFEGVSLLGGLPVIAIYFSTLRSQAEVRSISVFLIGLFQDLLSGGTIGVWALLYLSVYTLIFSQHEGFLQFVSRSALFSWLGFILVVALFAILSWIVGWLVIGAQLSTTGLFLQTSVAVLLYPVMLLWRPRPQLHPVI